VWCLRLAARRAERCTIVQSALRFYPPFFPRIFESLRNPRSPQPLIRARLVVQVHPGPPFKSPINTRLFSLFPFPGNSLTKLICQPFVNFSNGQAPGLSVYPRPLLLLGALLPNRNEAKALSNQKPGRVDGFLRVSAAQMDYFRVARQAIALANQEEPAPRRTWQALDE
jgi:hypothetical protein